MHQSPSASENAMGTEDSNFLNQLPLTTVHELIAFDESLQDKAKEAELVINLSY